MQCNVCGSVEFKAMNGGSNRRCGRCDSLERTRVCKLIIDKKQLARPGMRILHLAPERGLADFFRHTVGDNFYDPRDIDTERYQDINVTKFNLINSANLPSEYFDLIIHHHVMEHPACNITAVLYHLHRSLSKSGIHMFTIPIYDGRYDEAFGDLSSAERERRFGQYDHVRRFTREDLPLTLGMVFKLPDYDLTTLASEKELQNHNIPKFAWTGFSSHTVFMFSKGDILLKSNY